jgi:hypothetical protein
MWRNAILTIVFFFCRPDALPAKTRGIDLGQKSIAQPALEGLSATPVPRPPWVASAAYLPCQHLNKTRAGGRRTHVDASNNQRLDNNCSARCDHPGLSAGKGAADAANDSRNLHRDPMHHRGLTAFPGQDDSYCSPYLLDASYVTDWRRVETRTSQTAIVKSNLASCVSARRERPCHQHSS